MSQRSIRSFQARTLLMLAGCALCCTPAMAQDSVSSATGVGGDAIDAYDTTRQTVRYVVDLVPFTTSWGNEWGVAPVVKTSRDGDALFNTLALGAIAVSADQVSNASLVGVEQDFDVWTAAGQGVGDENSAASIVSVSSLDHRYGLALGDLNTEASNAIGAMIGFNDDDPNRLYVRRTMAAQSRSFSFLSDNGTVTAGAVDADGNVYVRADDFNGTGPNQIIGQNIISIDLYSRSSGLNGITKSGATNIAGNGTASSFDINIGMNTLNSPSAIPASLGASGQSVVFNFNGEYRVDGGAGTLGHLDAGVTGHRGNPTFSSITGLGGIGTIASLARTTTSPSVTAGFNLFGVDANGAVQTTASATMPIPMTGAPDLNVSGTAKFDQYNNQTSFRGPSGHAAIGQDNVTGDILVAATATDEAAGDYIAVARFGAGVTWEVAARIGTPVVDGPGGATIGVLGDAPFAAISAPAMDLYGNVYFTGLFDDSINPVVPAVFKAVDTASGYQLELILKEGQQFTGANSNTLYTIERLSLGDSDSIASSGLSAASVLQQADGMPSSAAAPNTVGGVVVGAKISYARVGGPETYDVALILKPKKPVGSTCAGDFDGDGDVDLGDFGVFGSAFNSMTGDANYDPAADFDGDGDVDLGDFGVFGGEFNRTDC